MAEMVKATLNGSYTMILPKHRADRPEWYTEEGWEGPRLDSLKGEIAWQKHKGQKPVVYYVGAEEGEMCGLCAIWGADVFMFEPNEKVMPNIKAIWEANGLDMDDWFYPGFAGNEDVGDQSFISIRDIKGEVIHDHGFKELRDPGERSIIKIDTVVEKTGKIPSIITMDVEGAEGHVLRGAEQTLINHRPTIFLSLHPEFLREQYDEWGRELRDWIINKGYRELFLDYKHEVHFVYKPI